MLVSSATLCVALSVGLVGPAVASPATALGEVGLRLSYSGRLVAAGGEGTPARSFRITYLVMERTDAGGSRVAWVLEELAGGPRWPWTHRFGTVPLNKSLSVTSDRELPSIQGERDGQVRAVPLRPPFYSTAVDLKAGAEWESNKLRHEVAGREEVAGRPCWRVAVSSNLGLRQFDWVDEKDHIVVRSKESVFLGQGVAHELTWELEKSEQLSAEDLARHAAAHAALVALRGPLRDKIGAGEPAEPPATPALLTQARELMAKIQGELKAGPYADLAKEVVRDTQAVIERRGALAKLADEIVGKSAKDFSLATTRGTKVSLADFKAKPVVLHFWEYRSEPKVAPYGETGYLDFVWRQREKQGVRVLGVAVDDRLREEATRSAGRKDIRAFCEFMNLSYPVAFDNGELIASFGDPRRVGGKLPLYIVIGPDGKVVEYHAGLWGTTADEGLKELDQRLEKLLR